MFGKYENQVKGAFVGTVVVGLCLVFILQFGGPQAQGCAEAEQQQSWAAQIYGTTLSEGDFKAAYALSGGADQPEDVARRYHVKEQVMDGLVERELLAREAERLGFRVTEDDVMSKLTDDGSIYFSAPVDAQQGLFGPNPRRVGFRDEHGNFDPDTARNFIRYRLRRSLSEFAQGQVRERLAQDVRDLVLASVTVSPAEVWDTFVREKEHVTLKYVRFAPVYYRDTLNPTPEELHTWAAAHQADIDHEYQRQIRRYTGLEKEVRARHILIKVEQSATPEVRAAARARAEALLVRVNAGEDFATLARQYSEDSSARRGGDLGYNPRGRMVSAFDEAQFGLQPGHVSGIVETQFGFHIIKVEGIREGDVPIAEAKAEITDGLYRDARAAELAQQAATHTLVELRGGLSMTDLAARLRAANTPPTPPGQTPTANQPAPSPSPAANANPDDDDADDDAVNSADPFAPRVRTTRPFGRTDNPVPGPFDSAPLARAGFELTAQNPLPAAPLHLGDEWFVFRLQTREDAHREDFSAEERARLTEGLMTAKQREVLAVYVRRLRQAAETAGSLRINQDLLRYGTEPNAEQNPDDHAPPRLH